eukprot:2538569-Amphidinium_carterae.1
MMYTCSLATEAQNASNPMSDDDRSAAAAASAVPPVPTQAVGPTRRPSVPRNVTPLAGETQPRPKPTVGPTGRHSVPHRSRTPGSSSMPSSPHMRLETNRRVVHVTIPPTRRRDAA